MRGKYLLLLISILPISLWAQWGRSQYLIQFNSEDIKLLPTASISFLGSDELIINQTLGVYTQKKWSNKVSTRLYVGSEFFNGGLLPQNQIKTSQGKEFSPYLGRVFTDGDWRIAPILRMHTEYEIHPSFFIYAGYDSRRYGNWFDSAWRDKSSTPTPYIGYDYNISEHLNYNFQIDYANNDGILGDASKGKYLATHSLGIKIKHLQLHFFESVVWRRKNENGYRGIEPIYLTPAMIFRPAEFSQGSSDNVLLGAGFEYKLYRAIKRKSDPQHGTVHKSNFLTFYGQITIDEFLYKEVVAKNGWWANKHAASFGVIFHSKIKNKYYFTTALSYAHTRPYTYTHSDSLQSYTNGAYSLAHFLGSNYRSLSASFYLKSEKWGIRSTLYFYRSGEDALTNNGTDVILSNNSRSQDYGNTIGQNSLRINHYIHNRILYYLDAKNTFFFEHQSHDKQHAFGFGYTYSLNSARRNNF
jgi:hypothetical protein